MKLSCFACENYIFIKTFMGKNILIGNGKKRGERKVTSQITINTI